MSVTAVLGAQWGDEGKGKIVDYLAASADMVIRFQGGDNAGHTVVNEFGEFKLHLVPSGIFNKSTTCLVGTGVVVNPISLLHEMNTLVEKNVSVDRLLISEKAHILMPYHIAVDKAEEANRNSKIGTTLRGIGPAYADKVARWGMQISEIYDKDNFVSKARERVERINLILKSVYNAEPVDFDAVMDEVWPACEVLRPHLTDSLSLIHAAMDRGEDILLEGQLGVMKDLDWGTYPFVTSSSPTSGGACVGAGIPPSRIEQVMGVVKAYSTSVGQGPMPTELFDEVGIMLCDRQEETLRLVRRDLRQVRQRHQRLHQARRYQARRAHRNADSEVVCRIRDRHASGHQGSGHSAAFMLYGERKASVRGAPRLGR